MIAQWFLSSLMFLVGLCVIFWIKLSSRMCYVKLLIYTSSLNSIHQIKTKKSAADINIGFAANIKFEKSNLNPNDPKVLTFNLNPNDPKVLTFKKEAGNFLAALLSHLLEKSPLKHALARIAAPLNPLNMDNKVKRSFYINHFSILLQRLVKANKISSQSAERAKAQYSSFFDVVDSNVTAFKDFSKENDRLDSFFFRLYW